MPLFENLFQSKTRKLLNLKKNGDHGRTSDWEERAVKTIIKHLTEHSAIDDLERAIIEENVHSKCVTIPTLLAQDQTLLDGNGNPTPPQLIACQYWRWPSLRTIHELRSTQFCEVGKSQPDNPALASVNQSVYICINPFHYDQVTSPRLPPVLVPKNAAYMTMEVHNGGRGADQSTNSLSNLIPSIQPDILMMPGDKFDFSIDSNRDMMMFDDVASAGTQNGNNAMETSMAENEHHRQQSQNPSVIASSDGSVSLVTNDVEPVMFIEPTYWCEVMYYELGKQVGTFSGRPRAITIDGFVDPCSSNRLCLGHFSNPERSPKVDDTRRHIGKGVCLWYIGGEVHVECLSQCAIWVQSLNCNQRFGWHPLTVVKIPPGNHLSIFSNTEFAKTLNQAVQEGYRAVYNVASACTIRISFAKGWGAEYKRQRITDCHCWVEIHLNGPLQWLDRVLSTMPSNEQTGSGT